MMSTVPDEYASITDKPLVKEALKVCATALNDVVESIDDSISSVDDGAKGVASRIDDLKTWLSTAVTDHETCLHTLEEASALFADEIKLLTENSTKFASNSLAIVTRLIGLIGGFEISTNKRLLSAEFPAWVGERERRMLQEVRPKHS